MKFSVVRFCGALLFVVAGVFCFLPSGSVLSGPVAAAMAEGAATATTLTLTSTVGDSHGGSLVRATLADASASRIAGAPVLLESSVDGIAWTGSWMLSTDAVGQAVASVPLIQTTFFRALYAGQQDAYLASASSVATAGYYPEVAWVTTPPAAASRNATFAVAFTAFIPPHQGCSGVLHLSRLVPGTWFVAERRTVVVRGTPNLETGRNDYSAVVRLDRAGDWQLNFVLVQDAVHLDGGLETRLVTRIASTTIGISTSKTSVSVGSAVTITGSMKSAASRRAIAGRWLHLESSRTGDTWTKVGSSAKTGSDGKVHFVVHPRQKLRYRIVYGGSRTWRAATSRQAIIETVFTLTGRRGGTLKTRRLWLEAGKVQIDVRMDGAHQKLSLWTVARGGGGTVFTGPGSSWVEIPWFWRGYHYFKVTGDGYFRIRVKA